MILLESYLRVPISKRLRVIDLSLGDMSKIGVEAIIENVKDHVFDNFKYLEMIDIHHCFIEEELSDRVVNELTPITIICVKTTSRYVSVVE